MMLQAGVSKNPSGRVMKKRAVRWTPTGLPTVSVTILKKGMQPHYTFILESALIQNVELTITTDIVLRIDYIANGKYI